MPAPSLIRLRAWRLVAEPAALDGARWAGSAVILRVAPDEAIGVGASGVTASDPGAIALPDAGLAGAWLDAAALERVVGRVEWRLPDARPATAQGKIAGVPAKLWLAPAGDGRGAALLVVQAAHADDLAERLGFATALGPEPAEAVP